MATVRYTGNAITRPQVTTITISSSTNGHTFTVTLNTKVVTYTASGDTTTTIAAALYALLADREEPDFTEITFDTSTNTVICTGPDDGTPFTLTLGGTGTSSQATTSGTPSSPNDMSIAANYSGGAVPSAADVLVFENNDVDVKWGLTTLASTGITLVRRATYTGSIGLPDWNPAGYPEYRTTHMSVKAATTTWESSPQDAAGQFRLNYLTTAATITVSGEPSGVEPGQEALEIKGTPASSILRMSGGSIAVCPVAGQTGTLDTSTAANGTVTIGSGTTLANHLTLDACRARVEASVVGTLYARSGADVVVGGAAAAAQVECHGGRVSWESTDGIGSGLVIGGGGEFTAERNPSAAGGVTMPSTVSLYAGFTLRDPNGKLTPGYDVQLVGTTKLSDGLIELKAGQQITIG